MKTNLIFLMSAILLFASPVYAKNCTKGQPCGNSCISWSKTCHKNTYSYQLPTESKIETKKPTITSTNILIRYVIPNSLSIYSAPNTSANINASLNKGDFVLLYRVEKNWAYISKSGIYGWVSKKHLSSSPTT